MQLSSGLLLATVLLAQASSGFYLSTNANDTYFPTQWKRAPKRQNPGYAKVEWTGEVIFELGHAGEPADIKLDAEGDIGKSGFILQGDRDDAPIGWYQLVRVGTKPKHGNSAANLTRPFAIEDGKFVYKGGEAKWNFRGYEDSWTIFLAIEDEQVEEDVYTSPLDKIGRVTLLAHES